MFSVISSTKFRGFRLNMVHSFLNKFAEKACKRFPPHLNNVSTLYCETSNAHRAGATTELSEKVTPKFIAPQLWPPNSPDLDPFAYNLCQYCKRKCTKHASLIWSYRRHQRRMAATMTTWLSLVHPVLSRCFSSFRQWSVFWTFALAIFPTPCNQVDSNLANLDATIKEE